MAVHANMNRMIIASRNHTIRFIEQQTRSQAMLAAWQLERKKV